MTTIKSLRRVVATSLVILICSGMGAAAATFTVTNTNDSGAGSLRQAVLDTQAAPGADTIVFDPAFFNTPRTITLASVILLSSGGPVIDDVTIVGPGPNLLTISGNNVTRHFTTAVSDTTSISGMTLTGGNGNNGGSIQNAGITTLTNIRFVQNTANSAGAIYSSGNGTTGGILNVADCQFINNTTTGTNINGDGGSAMELPSGRVTISNCTMTGGTTRGGGGAMRNSAITQITGTIISQNTSGGSGNSDGGGGIFNDGELTLTNCVLRENTAGENTEGGALRNDGQLTLMNTTVTNNTSTGDGGGIHENGADPGEFLTVINSTISHNVASGGNSDGGGIFAVVGSHVTIIGSVIHHNQCPEDGGGIFSDGAINIDKSTISSNNAGRDFGGVRVAHVFQDPVITNSTVANNAAARSGGGFGKDDCNLSCRTVSVGNTIISGNAGGDLKSGGPAGSDDNDSAIASLGYNLIGTFTAGTLYTGSSTDLIGVNPQVGPLQDNGGPTVTHALLPGSPAIDKGKRLGNLTTDQRGVPRPNDDPAVPNATGGDGSDIGAYEVGALNGVAEKTLGNIATRLAVSTGENVLIGGFIVVGQVPKRVIIRAIGPSLGTLGVNGALADPTLELFQGSTSIAFNNNWRDTQAAEITATGVAPSDDHEAAIVQTLAPGAYTAIVRGNGDSTGIGLVDGYDLEQRPDSKLGNIATRGFVSTGDNVLIGGFIAGPATRVAVRAIGPSLAAVGIASPLQDPTLELVDANGVVVRSNDNWKGIQQTDIEALNLQPADDRESALISTLTAGNYTAIVRGKDNGTGVGVVEVYSLQ